MCMCDATVRMFPYSFVVGTLANGGQSSGYGDAAATAWEGSLLMFLTPTGGECVVVCDT